MNVLTEQEEGQNQKEIVSEIGDSECLPASVYHLVYWPFFYTEFAIQSFAMNQLWSFY